MIGDCMKRQVVSVSPGTTVLGAARLVVDRHIGTLPVVDEQGTLIGVVRVQDILDIFMPDFVRLLEDIDFIHDFGVLETLLPKDLPDAARLTMRDLMQEPVSVEQTCGLLRAFATHVQARHSRSAGGQPGRRAGRDRLAGGHRGEIPGHLGA